MNTRMVLLAVILLAGRVEAGTINKPKLRKLAELPAITITSVIRFSTTYGYSFNQEKPNAVAEIARLRKQLKGDASDAERYQRLSLLYAKADRTKESDEASAKAVALCRQQVREHPQDMRWLAQLGDALVEDGQTEEGEKLLRRAVKEAPNEWRAWLALAQCVDGLSLRAVTGDKPFTFRYADHKLLIPALLKTKPTEKQIAAMRRLRKEAKADYDRAIALAPREAKSYLWRAASHGIHGAVEAGLHMGRGEKVNVMMYLVTPECAADMSRAARLSPNDPAAIGAAMFLEIMACILHDKMDLSEKKDLSADVPAAKDRSVVDFLPTASRDFVRWAMNRISLLKIGLTGMVCWRQANTANRGISHEYGPPIQRTTAPTLAPYHGPAA
ncbi:MAG TPA: tetratricopeptide repeat protein, partial [Gemmataceae bacterium]|nr:tetratricopeptide repeat protein [Gemmataceae bacterium]